MRELSDLSVFMGSTSFQRVGTGQGAIFNSGTVPTQHTSVCSVADELVHQSLYCRYLGKSELHRFYFQRRLHQPFLSLEYIYSGELLVRNQDHGLVGESGDLCLLHAGLDHDLVYSSGVPCVKLGIIIMGDLLPAVLKSLHLEEVEVVSLPDATRLEDLFQRLRETLLRGISRRHCEENSGLTLELLQMLGNVHRRVQLPPELSSLLSYLEAHACEPLDMRSVASRHGVSLPTMNNRFRAHLGTTPYQYLIRLRMHRACYLLLENHLSIKEIAEATGYGNALYFSSEFHRFSGCSPREYRRRETV